MKMTDSGFLRSCGCDAALLVEIETLHRMYLYHAVVFLFPCLSPHSSVAENRRMGTVDPKSKKNTTSSPTPKPIMRDLSTLYATWHRHHHSVTTMMATTTSLSELRFFLSLHYITKLISFSFDAFFFFFLLTPH
jgi:hypothetical protein